MATDFRRVIESLAGERVECVLIGGLALVAHGSSRLTVDLDLCYARSTENIERLVRALAPLQPRLRDFPPELPFFWDAQTVVLVLVARRMHGIFSGVSGPRAIEVKIIARDSEVEHLHLSRTREENIFWLDVPVDDALCVGRNEYVEELVRHREHFVGSEPTTKPYAALFERLAIEQLGDEKKRAVTIDVVVDHPHGAVVSYRVRDVAFAKKATLHLRVD